MSYDQRALKAKVQNLWNFNRTCNFSLFHSPITYVSILFQKNKRFENYSKLPTVYSQLFYHAAAHLCCYMVYNKE